MHALHNRAISYDKIGRCLVERKHKHLRTRARARTPVNALIHAQLHARAHTRTLHARTQWVLSYALELWRSPRCRYYQVLRGYRRLFRRDSPRPEQRQCVLQSRLGPPLRSPLPCASASGPGSPLPHLRRDCAHACHICAGTALTLPTSAPGLRSPVPTSAPRLGLTPATSAPGLGAALEPVGTASTRSSRRRTGARLARASRARDLRLHHGARPRHGRLGQALERAALGRRRFPCRGHRPRRDGASRDRQRAGGAGIARRGGRMASDLARSVTLSRTRRLPEPGSSRLPDRLPDDQRVMTSNLKPNLSGEAQVPLVLKCSVPSCPLRRVKSNLAV